MIEESGISDFSLGLRMKNIYEVLTLKELEISTLEIEVEAAPSGPSSVR